MHFGFIQEVKDEAELKKQRLKDEAELKKQRLDAEIKEIKNSLLLLTFANDVKSKLNIQESLQVLIAKHYSLEEIKNFDEFLIVKLYRDNLMVIQSDLISNQKSLAIVTNTYDSPIDQLFLSELQSKQYLTFKSLQEWYTFLDGLNAFFIPKSKLQRFSIKLRPADYFSVSDKTKTVALRKESIMSAFNSLEEEEQNLLFQSSQGKSGIKAAVKRKIPSQDYNQLFEKDHDFDNAWSEVRKNLLKNAP